MMPNRPILYAEDEENDVFFMERAFEIAQVRHPLIAVSNGQKAIDYCSGTGDFTDREKFPLPGLILLDLNMPRKSGFEVLKQVRKDPAICTVPVIFLTSSLQDSDIVRAYADGANAYLVKPSSPDEMVNLVKSIHEFWLKLNRTMLR